MVHGLTRILVRGTKTMITSSIRLLGGSAFLHLNMSHWGHLRSLILPPLNQVSVIARFKRCNLWESKITKRTVRRKKSTKNRKIQEIRAEYFTRCAKRTYLKISLLKV